MVERAHTTINRTIKYLDTIWEELDADPVLWRTYRDDVFDAMDTIRNASESRTKAVDELVLRLRKRGNRLASHGRCQVTIRRELWQSRPHACQECGLELTWDIFEAHHVVPLSVGGTDDDSNLRMLCCNCHAKYGKRQHRLRVVSNPQLDEAIESLIEKEADKA